LVTFELADRDVAETESVISNADPKAQMFNTFAEEVIPRDGRLERLAA
jgi:hypothetical protein